MALMRDRNRVYKTASKDFAALVLAANTEPLPGSHSIACCQEACIAGSELSPCCSSLLPLQTGQACKRNSDWMFGGDGAYVPHPSSAVDMKLRLHEIVNVFDIGLVAHPGRALLDSGALHTHS